MKIFFVTILFILSVNVYGVKTVQTYKGMYVWGHEVNTFRSCGSKTEYWISAADSVLAPLVKYYEGNTTKSYQAIYVVFRGYKMNKATDGFAADYPGVIKILEVKMRRLKAPGKCH
ncbi:hypothetical protein MNBD_GAMMA12-3948 [hydrothermal vent metagenome]|uniref:NlpE C-terminal OB domain-containing protein n=1 Tax=hydrothermal vent metagenome TaxID=652676 RepID=A0A3B0YI01_9ZZZZ